MAFWETEFVDILNFIDNLIENFKNKDFIVDVLMEVKRIRQIVPLNPGIVAMCAKNIMQNKNVDNILEQNKFLIKTINGEEYYGFVKSDEENFYIDKLTIKKSEIKSIYYLKKDTLETFWPTLIHEVRER